MLKTACNTRPLGGLIGLAALAAGATIATPAVSGDVVGYAGDAMAGDTDAGVPSSVSVTMPSSRRPPVRRSTAGGSLVDSVAQRYRIDPHLLASIVRAESGGHAAAVSRKGALGLMQVMPATARSMGVADPSRLLADQGLALETGAAYLKTLQRRLGNDVPLVVAAYNAGPGAVTKAGMRVPAIHETQAYVGRVMAGYAASRAAALR